AHAAADRRAETTAARGAQAALRGRRQWRWPLFVGELIALGSTGMPEDRVTVVLPCLNEEESLPAVLAAIPAGYRALVVDNNSTDDTAGVASRYGAAGVAAPRPGYGSAGHHSGGAAGAGREPVRRGGGGRAAARIRIGGARRRRRSDDAHRRGHRCRRFAGSRRSAPPGRRARAGRRPRDWPPAARAGPALDGGGPGGD